MEVCAHIDLDQYSSCFDSLVRLKGKCYIISLDDKRLLSLQWVIIPRVMPLVHLYLLRSNMNGSLPFDRTIEQTTESMPLTPENNSNCHTSRPVELQAYKSCWRSSRLLTKADNGGRFIKSVTVTKHETHLKIRLFHYILWKLFQERCTNVQVERGKSIFYSLVTKAQNNCGLRHRRRLELKKVNS